MMNQEITILEERFNLSYDRICQISETQEVAQPYQEYFRQVADFIKLVKDSYEKVQKGYILQAPIEDVRAMNYALYEDVVGENYEKSFANPTVASECFGTEMGKLLAFLYTEIRCMIPYAFEESLEDMVIRMELFVEVYSAFAYAALEGEQHPDKAQLKETMYWYVSDYSETAVEWRVRTMLEPTENFAVNIIMNSDFSDMRYLYQYGEYISQDTEKLVEYFNKQPQEKLQMLADTYTEGYRIGFVKGNKDLSKKEVVDIRFIVGFEPVVKLAINNFAKMGLKPTVYRATSAIFLKRGNNKIGYYGAIPNKQFDYDHKDDMALFLDKKSMNRLLEVTRQAYEAHKEMAAKFAGPAVIEAFGETPFEPQSKETACSLNAEQQKLSAEFRAASAGIVNEYIKGEERSFTIIAFPVPEIGERFEEIFDETIKINTLDYQSYEKMQAIIIETLDKADYVEVKGMNGNKTNMHINLYKLANPQTETIFENCVADVNIPVGEVFTSPVLEGTYGTLHVSRVFLNELEYHNLEMTFKDGKITDYTCTNFDNEKANKEYLKANVLYHYDTLPIGEFAIGTNTTAYMTAKKYDIGNRFPILIAEKTGPHFAVGDTCYSRSEDVKVYNEDGKEIVARDNSVSILRKTEPSKAYFGCHTDITIPYDELGAIIAYDTNGNAYPIIENGRFVLAGCEELNVPFDK